MSEQNLKERTVKGVSWSAIDNVAQFGMSFVIGIILARLLSPDDYGLIGIIGIFTAVCNTIIKGGFTTALVRKKVPTEDDYNTVFLINFGMSLLLYAVLFFCAPLIADFFGREELVLLTRVASINMIIGALSMVQVTRLIKRIDFKTQTKITIIATIISGVIGVTCAFLGFGVWALVIFSLTSQLVSTVCLWLVNKWIPNFTFSVNSFKELFGFGWKILASYLLDTVWKELYQVVVGKFYNPATLGQYTRAKNYAQMFSTNVTNVIQRVTFPVLSEIQDDRARMLSAYRRMIKTTMFISAIGMFLLGAVSEPLIYCLIGPKWHEAAIYLPLICIAGSLYPLSAINLNMLQVQGRSDLFLGLEIIKKIIALAPLFIGAFVGIMPMLYTNLLTCIIGFFLNSYYSGKFLGYTSWMQIKDIAPSYCLATVMALSVWFFKFLPFNNWIILFIQSIVSLLVFFSACKFYRIEEYNEIKAIVLPMLKKIKIFKK